jgi:transcription-repair coupling factor (superfamily II helicase)
VTLRPLVEETWRSLADQLPQSGALVAPESSYAFLLALLQKSRANSQNTHPVAVVCANGREAELVARGLTGFDSDIEIIHFDSWETLPHERLSPSPETVGKRLRALHRIAELEANPAPAVIVMGLRALLQPIIGDVASHQPILLRRGERYLFEELGLKLIEYAYQRVDMVTRRGEYAIRGGILDIFPTTAEHALRLEFFGDELEDIREFAVSDQRSVAGKLTAVELYPARELLITPEVAARAREMSQEFPNLTEMLEKISQAIPVDGMESLAPVLTSQLMPITEFLGPEVPLILLNPEKLAARAQGLVDTNEEFLHAAWDAAIAGAKAPIDLSAVGFYELEKLMDAQRAKRRPIIQLTPFAAESNSADIGLKAIPSFRAEDSSAIDWLSDQLGQGNRVLITAEGHGTAERLLEIVTAAGLPAVLSETVASLTPGQVTITQASLSGGFVLPSQRLVTMTEAEFFGKTGSYFSPQQRKLARRRGAEVDPLELRKGDYVVHEIHGVGRFLELVQRASGVGKRQHSREYLVIEYAPPRRGYPADTLFVPTDQLDLLTRYVGGEAPVLSKMGGTDWARAKGNARKAVRKIAIDLVKLYSARMKAPGYAFGSDTPWQHELEEAFAFTETPDQLTTIDEVKRDMEKPIPMDRLLAGDVGYGKTEVAVRAAFKAIQDGKQVAMLVPTTLLVRQHIETIRERFSAFPVRVAALSRFQSAAEVRKTLGELESGAIDMVIGTHRLLSGNIRFKDLGLVIIDEEQRFGVEHKEKLKELKTNVDVLAMSATPIPRTLEMAVTGIREMSTLATPPEERHPILTFVGGYSEKQVAAAIRRELIREGQVFYVHNRVSSIAAAANQIAKLVPEARIAVAHGQLPEDQLERVVVDFWERKFDVLVSTTIIETGIDIPNANTLIVDRAENFGLSQLHQIRGRVGRSRERGYAYFFYDPSTPLSETAHDRLATIATHNELGSGMQVAMKDLEIRGAGNLLGGEQSGHIAGVGFDLYLRMIAEAVSEFRGEKVESPAELKLELPVAAHIPATYLDSERLRLEAYHKLSAASGAKATPAQLREILAELEDRYGPAPEPVLNLIAITELRQHANRCGLKDVNLLGATAKFQPVALTDSELVQLSHKLPGVRYLQSSQLLSMPAPVDSQVEPLRDAAVIDWLWQVFEKLFNQVVRQP